MSSTSEPFVPSTTSPPPKNHKSPLPISPFLRRCGSHRALELPLDAADLEVVSGLGDGEHGRPETRDLYSSFRFAARRDLRRSGIATGGVQRRNWTRFADEADLLSTGFGCLSSMLVYLCILV